MPFDPLNVLVVHGMGNQPPSFSRAFEQKLASKVRSWLDHLSRTCSLSKMSSAEPLNFIAGWWAPVMNAALSETGGRIYKTKMPYLREFGMSFMGDVVAYQGRTVYEEIHRYLDGALRKGLKIGSGHLTIIAHSLGSVIASDFVYDHTIKIGKTLGDGYGVTFSNFFTLGSPLVLYAMRSGLQGPFHPSDILDRFDRPVHVESGTGVWLNLFDDDDIIGYPIKPINRFYRSAVTADLVVEVGDFLTRWNPLSHGHYWGSGVTVDIIAEKLAIDFAAQHLGLSGAPLETALAAYRTRHGF
jgi:pimeloyl-ACP methyl ester carboxylesterase